jgi:hypothetical protein
MKYFIFAAIVLFLAGCASLFHTKPAKTPAEERKEFLDKYEKTFNPSEYDEAEETVNAKLNDKKKNLLSTSDTDLKEPEIISGFRIQLLMTPEIDQANKLKIEVTPLLNDLVYVIFDAPYYKVRVGDCKNRTTANQLLKFFIERGYKNAWIVPDKVYKNPQKPKEETSPTDINVY